MFGTHLRFEVVIESKCFAHLGGTDNRTAELQDEGVTTKVVSIVRDHDGNPVIPASSLKGALVRSARRAFGTERAEKMFGTILNHQDETGRIARLWLDHGSFLDGPDLNEYAGSSSETMGEGVVTQTHVSIDEDAGAAQTNHLYRRDMLPPATRFAISGKLFTSDMDELAEVLALLSTGLRLGKSTTKGHGAFACDLSSLMVAKIGPRPDGRKTKTRIAADALHEVRKHAIRLAEDFPERTYATALLPLECVGPYMSVRAVEAEKDGDRKKILPLEHQEKPVLQPESLIGALRSRARWLLALDEKICPVANQRGNASLDDRKLEHALGGQKQVNQRSDLEKLTACEKLFGVTGLRSRVSVVSISCSHPGSRAPEVAGNSIDRITGGVRDGFLFAKAPYWNPKFRIELTANVKPDTPEAILWKALIADVRENGIELAHGASTGFGWFKFDTAEATKTAEEAA